MKLRTSLYIQLLILVTACVISAVYYFRLPDVVPTHWNIHNQVDQYGSKFVPVIMGPGLMLLSILMTVFLPKISPKKFEIDKFISTFAYAMLLVAGLFMFLNVMILRATAGVKLDFGGTLMAGMFVFFALLGNVMGKVQQNFFMGIRTPWTLASARVWDATHRLAGRLWLVGGLIGAILAFAGMPILGSVAILVILGFIPVIQSYLLYQKLER